MQQLCENCEFFVQHYTHNGARFHKIDCGHCGHNRVTKKEFAKNRKTNNCEFWKEKENRKAKQRELTLDVIADMERSLHALALILQADEQ